MKKSEFKGIDLMAVNKFKAPIEKFNSNNKHQECCKDKIDEIKTKNYEVNSIIKSNIDNNLSGWIMIPSKINAYRYC